MKKREINPLEEIMSNPYYRLRDEYNDAEKIKWTMSFAQYSMTYWAAERDIVLNGTKKRNYRRDIRKGCNGCTKRRGNIK